jgi:HK97 family phage major capsid protein
MELKDLQTTIETRLDGITADIQKNNTELKTAFEQRLSEVEKKGVADPETKEKIDRLFTRADELEAKMGAPNPAQRVIEHKSVGDRFIESPVFQNWKAAQFLTKPEQRILIGAAFGPSAYKATMTNALIGSTPSQVTGVAPLQRVGVFDALPMQRLTIRDLLAVRPVDVLTVVWLRQASRTNAASPQVEGVAKAESTYTWESVSTPMRTIAHFFQVTTQALADLPWLRSEVDSELMYGLKLKEETELLAGDGLGAHISGLIPNATAYSTALNVSGDTKLDKLRHAIYQARLALYPVDGIVMHPKDVHDIELLKTEEGGANKGVYLVGDPQSGLSFKTAWGLPIVESDSMTIGTFLTGGFNSGAILFDRQQAVIDISFEHGTNFTENEATIRCEERIGLGIRRALAFVYGSF